MQIPFPDGKRFAFTIFDDTDNATLANIGPVYRLLSECGMRSTKSVWIYPPRGRFTGASLDDAEYLKFIIDLKSAGFEIALHNVGDGAFDRQEIADGIETFRSILGSYPVCHANHSLNPDNIYWGPRRFEWPFDRAYALASRAIGNMKSPASSGHDPSSRHFWGDICKERIRFIRNFTFNGINTLRYDPRMPYRIAGKQKYSNLWFSSSDGHTVREFTDLLAEENCDRLEDECGVCVVYTHFASGFVDERGCVDPVFEHRIRYLAAKRGWFAPVSAVLDLLQNYHQSSSDPGYPYRLGLNVRWAIDRVLKKLRYSR